MASASPKEKFDAAVKVIHSLPKNGPFQPSREMMLMFYAYYKQATLGKCSIPKPSFWDLVNKAKWDAWNNLGDMDRDTAMTKYVEELKKTLKLGEKQWNEMASNGDPRIVEAMPQTQVVGDFMDKLGAFYEIVDEDSPIERARRANSKLVPLPKLMPQDHNYNIPPLESGEQPLQLYGVEDNVNEEEGREEDDSGVNLTNGEASQGSPGGHHEGDREGSASLEGLNVESSESEDEFCDTSMDLEVPVKHLNAESHMTSKRHVRFSELNGRTEINGDLQDSMLSPGFSFISSSLGRGDNDSLVVETSSPAHFKLKELKNDLDICDGDLELGAEVSVSNGTMLSVGANHDDTQSSLERWEENEPPNGGGDKDPSKEKEKAKSSQGQGSSSGRSGSRNLPGATGGGGRRLLLAGGGAGGDGGGDAPTTSNTSDNVSEQIANTLVRLQQDMASVLDRLNRLEAQSRQNQRQGSPGRSIFWWPFNSQTGRTAFFFLVWPVIVHILLTYMFRRRRRK
ncbi:acyl-CoA-binding domain-containing protein 5-like isoform X2 [Dreissena polymorpha]|uniref:acyl-CoA-binding domain-containing protein 5-like isoform X2 n=1 Tax=Dreissena polymorpha TaxID=45954 RepID=UPI0022642430|nr:acyl-CoA-binding domain-containing protein 5-like isoform X2 [Dreissena polymorpha]